MKHYLELEILLVSASNTHPMMQCILPCKILPLCNYIYTQHRHNNLTLNYCMFHMDYNLCTVELIFFFVKNYAWRWDYCLPLRLYFFTIHWAFLLCLYSYLPLLHQKCEFFHNNSFIISAVVLVSSPNSHIHFSEIAVFETFLLYLCWLRHQSFPHGVNNIHFDCAAI